MNILVDFDVEIEVHIHGPGGRYTVLYASEESGIS
jgi:hypothetical protein